MLREVDEQIETILASTLLRPPPTAPPPAIALEGAVDPKDYLEELKVGRAETEALHHARDGLAQMHALDADAPPDEETTDKLAAPLKQLRHDATGSYEAAHVDDAAPGGDDAPPAAPPPSGSASLCAAGVE